MRLSVNPGEYEIKRKKGKSFAIIIRHVKLLGMSNNETISQAVRGLKKHTVQSPRRSLPVGQVTLSSNSHLPDEQGPT